MEGRFVDAVVAPDVKSLTDAARRAGYAQPLIQGSRVNARPDVQEAIAARKAELAAKLDAVALQAANLMPGKLADARLDDLSKVTARSVTTAALLRGEATAITANTTVSVNVELQAKASSLAELFGVDPARVLADLAGD